MSTDDSTLPGTDPAPVPGPDPVFEWLSQVLMTAVYRIGGGCVPSGTVTEERRHHASWEWPASGRKVTLTETIPHGRQLLSVSAGTVTAWYEGTALRWFPGLEDMIMRDLGVPGATLRNPGNPGYPPIQ